MPTAAEQRGTERDVSVNQLRFGSQLLFLGAHSAGLHGCSSPEAEAADSASPMEQVVPDGSPPKVDGRGRTPKR